MKKIVNIISIFLVLFLLLFSTNIYADALDTLDITVDKEIVHPGETVKVNIQFGKELGAYTFNIAYDNNLLEYVSAEGGTANDNGTRVKVYFYDETGGSNPRNDMSVVFKAKEGIITSNPTDFSITAEGLANPDASVNYDDIGVPIVKNTVVEPIYEDYNIDLNYTGDIIKNKEKDMKIIISSSMGKSYEKTRIIAEATTPENETVKFLAIDEQGLTHDIIESGWGEAEGDPIGGKDVKKELDIKGLFSGAGKYTVKLKLIDREKSDAEIVSKTFDIQVKEESTVTTPEDNENPPVVEKPDNDNNNVNNDNNNQNNNSNVSNQEENNKPDELPKTGNTVYIMVVPILIAFIILFIYLRRKN